MPKGNHALIVPPDSPEATAENGAQSPNRDRIANRTGRNPEKPLIHADERSFSVRPRAVPIHRNGVGSCGRTVRRAESKTADRRARRHRPRPGTDARSQGYPARGGQIARTLRITRPGVDVAERSELAGLFRLAFIRLGTPGMVYNLWGVSPLYENELLQKGSIQL